MNSLRYGFRKILFKGIKPLLAEKSKTGLILAAMVLIILMLVSPGWAENPGSGTPNFLPEMYQRWPTPTATPRPGYLLITEVLYDPEGSEPGGEWVEIFNAGETALDLSNYKLGDEEVLEGPEGMFQFPAGAIIPAGGVVIIANQANTFYSLFKLLPDYELYESHPFIPNMVKYTAWSGGNVELSNSGDEVLLLDVFDQRADGLSWGDSQDVLNPPLSVIKVGHSYERKPAYQDTNSADDWIDQDVPTPGKVYFSLPTVTPTSSLGGTPTPDGPPGLLVSEVLYDPLGDDPDGEWIEIYNFEGSMISLDGLRIGDEESPGGGEGMLLFPPGWQVAPGQAIVIANRAAVFSETFGLLPDFEIYDCHILVPEMLRDAAWGRGAVNLGNTVDEVLLLDWTGIAMDAVSWGSSTFAFDPPVPGILEGHSLERYPPGNDTDRAADWRDQPKPGPGEVDLSSPTPTTLPSPTPSPVPGILINEIHADPHATLGDANADGLVSGTQDEFIEIVNNTGVEADLSGWKIPDGVSVRHIFPAGSMIANNCAVLIFGAACQGAALAAAVCKLPQAVDWG
jgi:hypothetical protein